MIGFGILILVLDLMLLADAAVDKLGHKPSWTKLYHFPRWVPKPIRRKLQNRTHIVKHVRLLLPSGALALWAVSFLDVGIAYQVAAFVVLIVQGQIVWKYAIKDPEHWG